MVGKSKTRKCLVCDSTTTNSHYGIDACRACASFFKRAKTMRKAYICRQGNQKCNIKLHEPFLCRHCRLEKCIALGMSLELHPLSRPPPSDPAPSPSTSEDSVSKGVNLLQLISTEYQASLERRKKGEMALRTTSKYDSVEVFFKGTQFFRATINFIHDALRLGVTDIVQFIEHVAPEYAKLDRSLRQVHLKSITPVFYIMEGCYLTEEFFPKSDKFFLGSVTTFFDTENFESFVSSSEEGVKDSEECIKNMKFYTDKSFEITMRAIRYANLSEMEYHSILYLLVWTFDHAAWMPAPIVELGETMRRRIFEGLHDYYKNELKREEYATRIGQLMSLMHAVQEASLLMMEEFTMYKLLDLFREGHFISKLLLS